MELVERSPGNARLRESASVVPAPRRQVDRQPRGDSGARSRAQIDLPSWISPSAARRTASASGRRSTVSNSSACRFCRVVGEVESQEQPDPLVGESRGGPDPAHRHQAAGPEAGLFLDFAGGALLGWLAAVELSRRHLQQPAARRVTVLADEQDPSLIVHGTTAAAPGCRIISRSQTRPLGSRIRSSGEIDDAALEDRTALDQRCISAMSFTAPPRLRPGPRSAQPGKRQGVGSLVVGEPVVQAHPGPLRGSAPPRRGCTCRRPRCASSRLRRTPRRGRDPSRCTFWAGRRPQVGLDARGLLVVERHVLEGRRVEIAIEMAVDHVEDVAVELGGHTLAVVVGGLERLRRP